MLSTKQRRFKKKRRIRAKISGTGKIPRLCVFRSNKHIYAQLIDDVKGIVLCSVSDLELKKTKSPAGKKRDAGKIAVAREVGKLLAKKAQEKKIEEVIFDRAGFKYHGRIKALAEGAREGGLKF